MTTARAAGANPCCNMLTISIVTIIIMYNNNNNNDADDEDGITIEQKNQCVMFVCRCFDESGPHSFLEHEGRLA